MNLKEHATKTLAAQGIPKRRQTVIWKNTVQGAIFVLVGVGLLCVACRVILATNTINTPALTLIVVGLAVFAAGWHIASKQVTRAAVLWLADAAQNIYAAVRGKTGTS